MEGAIIWHEKAREKRQKLKQERYESKQAYLGLQKWEFDNVKKVRDTALENMKEDWALGDLRPNRAFGGKAQKYGALTGQSVQKPEIPVHTQKMKNEQLIRRGLEPQYPLIVDDKKYFHIERDDRVVVVHGRDRGKIGLVQDVLARTHEVIVKGVNMVLPQLCPIF